MTSAWRCGKSAGDEKLATRIKELQPQVSNRSLAKVLGVDEIRVRRDTAANAVPAPCGDQEPFGLTSA